MYSVTGFRSRFRHHDPDPFYYVYFLFRAIDYHNSDLGNLPNPKISLTNRFSIHLPLNYITSLAEGSQHEPTAAWE
ncbi:MAG TPA: hypothetical protein DEB05_05875 [Firmicutes bacterium]|jgi:hypothetical protein|nr:hypothetical protein [Bacillota bacterium]